MKLDYPLSFDNCYISFVLFYTDFTFHNVPSDQVVVINGDRTDEIVISISRGTYDIETIIAMLNASDSLFEVVYSGENAFRVYNQFVILPLTQLIHSLNSAIHLSRCVGSMNEIKELWKPAKRRGATRVIISRFKRNIYFIDLIDFSSKQHKWIQEVLG